MNELLPEADAHRQLAIRLATTLKADDRAAVAGWLQELLDIRTAPLPARVKALRALQITAHKSPVWAIAEMIAGEFKRFVWDDRGLSARIAMGAILAALVLAGRRKAGIAALGTAVGVPLWIVFGAGGAFAGMLIEEITRKQPPD